MKKSYFREFISLIFILALTAVLAIVFYLFEPMNTNLVGIKKIVSEAMYLYLIFILVRTVFLLIFSFAEYFFRPKLEVPKNFPLISIIVPSFNEEKVLRNAIESLERINYPNFEIIIVDDGSKDETFTEGKKLLKKGKVRIIYQDNAGKAEALNRGISEAFGDYVLCVDADSVIDTNALMHGMMYFERNKNLAAVAGSVFIGNSGNTLTHFQKLEYIVGLNFHKVAQSFAKAVNIVPGPIGLFKKSALLSVGGYHSHTFAEDCDLTIRLLMAGYEIEYCPEMIAVTEAPEDIKSLISQRYRWSRGIIQAIMKNIDWLKSPIKNPRNFAIILFTVTESIFIPTTNFLFAFFSVEEALLNNETAFLGPFFLGLTTLDLVLTIYSLNTKERNIFLIVLASINRITYGLFLEILRFLATIDEIFKLPMSWNKLTRKGL